MNIRPAIPSDAEQWAQMRSELWPDNQDDHPQEIHAFFQGTLIDIDKAIVLETDNGELAGFLELNLRSYAEGSRISPIPYIEAWYVRPEFQHKGYGQQLMSYIENWARNKGFTEIASDTTPDNKRSIKLHKQLGFKQVEQVVCFLKKL